MRKVKFTDSFRYPNSYIPSGETNISKTFDRIRREQKCTPTTAEVKSAVLKPLTIRSAK